MILVGRAICGVTSSVALPGAYTYVAEISSSCNRGFFVEIFCSIVRGTSIRTFSLGQKLIKNEFIIELNKISFYYTFVV